MGNVFCEVGPDQLTRRSTQQHTRIGERIGDATSATRRCTRAPLLTMRALRSPLCLLVLLCAALLGAAFETADSVVDPDVKPPSFNKAELEELLKKEH